MFSFPKVDYNPKVKLIEVYKVESIHSSLFSQLPSYSSSNYFSFYICNIVEGSITLNKLDRATQQCFFNITIYLYFKMLSFLPQIGVVPQIHNCLPYCTHITMFKVQRVGPSPWLGSPSIIILFIHCLVVLRSQLGM